MVDRLGALLANNLGPEMVQLIQGLVAGASLNTSGGSPLATLISAGALLYAATGLFSQLQYALNTIWDVPPATYAGTIAAIKNRLLAFLMVLGLALLLI
ncbi:MAG: YihY/virulence factor BrkB family protein, partial [Anaerolineae bacterium]|nr:YihY/virulence factor BrkB family protein [Anaerolineae bacterium]